MPSVLFVRGIVAGVPGAFAGEIASAPSSRTPAEFSLMLPYVLTILVLVIWGARHSGRRGAPAALGVPYVRDER